MLEKYTWQSMIEQQLPLYSLTHKKSMVADHSQLLPIQQIYFEKQGVIKH